MTTSDDWVPIITSIPGPQGPQGPQGPSGGPQGPQGQPGGVYISATPPDITEGESLPLWLDTTDSATSNDTGWVSLVEFNSSGVVSNGAWHTTAGWGPRSSYAGWVRIRRIENDVVIWLHNVSPTTSGTDDAFIVSLPNGYRPIIPQASAVAHSNAGTRTAIGCQTEEGILSGKRLGSSSDYLFNCMVNWLSAENFPE